jgi:hypothetical protein
LLPARPACRCPSGHAVMRRLLCSPRPTPVSAIRRSRERCDTHSNTMPTSAEAKPTLTRDPATSVPPLDPLVPLGPSCKSLAQPSYCAAVRWPAAWRYEMMSGIMEARTLSRGNNTVVDRGRLHSRGRVWNAHFEPESGTHAAVLAQAWAMMMAHTVPLFSV